MSYAQALNLAIKVLEAEQRYNKAKENAVGHEQLSVLESDLEDAKSRLDEVFDTYPISEDDLEKLVGEVEKEAKKRGVTSGEAGDYLRKKLDKDALRKKLADHFPETAEVDRPQE